MSARVVIIGCGYAGAAAALACAEHAEKTGTGLETLVLESRPRPGGRASSFYEKNFDSTLDNGQHLFMGCYHSALRLLTTLGTDKYLEEQSRFRVDFLYPADSGGRVIKTLASAPLHSGFPDVEMLLGIFCSNQFTLCEKFSLVNAFRAIKRIQPESMRTSTVAQMLTALKQTESHRKKFWEPFVIAVMNNTPENACAALLVEVFHRAFFGAARDAKLMIPRAGLSELLAPIDEFLRARSGGVRYGATVHAIKFERDRAVGVWLASGEYIAADAVISAVPANQLLRLLPEPLRTILPFRNLREFIPSPIVSVYLLFNRQISDMPFAAAMGTTIQWVFTKSRSTGNAVVNGEQLLSCVMSAVPSVAAMPAEEIRDLVMRDIHSLFPESRSVALLHWRVVKERNATFLCTPAVEALRPSVATSVANLFLAGDWTDTKLPATIEGAAQSGFAAAEELLKRL